MMSTSHFQQTNGKITFSKDAEISVNRRYLGSKARLKDWIISILGRPHVQRIRFIDVFAGTGIVSRAAAQEGWSVVANDHLKCAAIMTEAQLATKATCFFHELGGYKKAIESLNYLKGREGFFYREYSPSNSSNSGHNRLYFTPENATKIDAIRSRIKEWHDFGVLNNTEEAVLIADLMNAVDSVANTAGTYGCFLRQWYNNALQALKLHCRDLLDNNVSSIVTCSDYKHIQDNTRDVAYIDPPYTKRQYAAYYHILETIAWGDEPVVQGVTGLRPWQDKSSDFCYKHRAERALQDVLHHLKSKRVLLSYSSEGHMDAEQIIDILNDFGKYVLHLPKHIPRYNTNGNGSNPTKLVKELLFELRR